MSNENKNKPASPCTDGVSFANDGLTKREYFAGLLLQGILSSRGLQEALNKDRDNWIEYAVKQADALLLELDKQ